MFLILVETFLSQGGAKPIQANNTHSKYKYFMNLEYFMPLLYKSSLFHAR